MKFSTMKRKLLGSCLRTLSGVSQCLMLGALAFVSPLVNAQSASDWPTKEIRLIVPFGPGSTPDQIARVVGAEASALLGQSIVIENRPGAGGNIGTSAIARARPDGYTFGISINGPLVYNQYLYQNLPFNPDKDLYPLTLAVTQPNVIAVRSDSGIESLAQLAERIKANPDTFNFATPGTGSGSHLTQELFLQAIDGEALAIPYNSSAQALNSLLAGDTQFTALAPIALVPLAQDGRLRLLAQTGAERMAALPDVPTISETGVVQMQGAAWSGFVIAEGVPQAIKDRLQQALVAALQHPEVVATLRAQYMEPTPSTTEEFRAYIAEEKARWQPLIESLDVQM